MVDYLDEMNVLYDKLGEFIDRGEFAKHGMSIERMSDGAITLEVYDINPNLGFMEDYLIFTINVAKDGVADGWTPVQWVDNREGFIVSVVRKHPSKGNIVLESNVRVDGGFRSLTAYIRNITKQVESEVPLEFSPPEIEEYEYYASTKKSVDSEEEICCRNCGSKNIIKIPIASFQSGDGDKRSEHFRIICNDCGATTYDDVQFSKSARKSKMKKSIVNTRSAVWSNYSLNGEKTVALVGDDDKLYMGLSRNYDNQGHYDNEDDSLVLLSDSSEAYGALYGSGWVVPFEELGYTDAQEVNRIRDLLSSRGYTENVKQTFGDGKGWDDYRASAKKSFQNSQSKSINDMVKSIREKNNKHRTMM